MFGLKTKNTGTIEYFIHLITRLHTLTRNMQQISGTLFSILPLKRVRWGIFFPSSALKADMPNDVSYHLVQQHTHFAQI